MAFACTVIVQQGWTDRPPQFVGIYEIRRDGAPLPGRIEVLLSVDPEKPDDSFLDDGLDGKKGGKQPVVQTTRK
jgi:hypothetical protein